MTEDITLDDLEEKQVRLLHELDGLMAEKRKYEYRIHASKLRLIDVDNKLRVVQEAVHRINQAVYELKY